MDDWNAQGWLYFDTVLWLSYLCNTKELKLLLAFFWVSNSLVRIVSLFIVQGILGLRGTNDHAGWQYVFLQKGLLTFVIGVFSILNISVGPTQTQNWFYKNVWFTEREEYIIVSSIFDRSNASLAQIRSPISSLCRSTASSETIRPSRTCKIDSVLILPDSRRLYGITTCGPSTCWALRS